MNRQYLPKQMRLLNLNEFISVFQESKHIKMKTGITLFTRSNSYGYPRIGLAISKKYIKYAHERNRIKRYIRETFRVHKHNLSATDFVLTVHSKKILYLNNQDLIIELIKLWNYHYVINHNNMVNTCISN